MTLKPGPTFKMSKMHKMWLANYVDRDKYNSQKKSMIQAQLYGAELAKQQDKKKQNTNSSED